MTLHTDRFTDRWGVLLSPSGHPRTRLARIPCQLRLLKSLGPLLTAGPRLPSHTSACCHNRIQAGQPDLPCPICVPPSAHMASSPQKPDVLASEDTAPTSISGAAETLPQAQSLTGPYLQLSRSCSLLSAWPSPTRPSRRFQGLCGGSWQHIRLTAGLWTQADGAKTPQKRTMEKPLNAHFYQASGPRAAPRRGPPLQ